METPKEHLESLFGDAGDYLKNKTQLWKLKLVDKASSLVATIVETVALVFFAIIFFFFINIALALLIGYWLGHSFYGFFIMAALYLIAGFIIHKSREKLFRTPIINSLIQKFVK
jgi:hypothetical protein